MFYDTTGGGILGAIKKANDSTLTTYSNDCPITYFYPGWQSPDKTAQALRVVKALMEQGAIVCDSIKKFLELVDAVSKVL